MIKKIITILLITFSLFSVLQAQNNKYQVYINLNNVVKDKLQVTIKTPTVISSEIEFHIPKIVPGTYSIYNFGRFSTEFEAKDKEGNLLPVNRISPNRRLIKNATSLSEISYWVEDTYDTNQENFVFEPGGTNIETGKNFIINTYGFIGYLDGMKDLSYQLEIEHHKKMFGATALNKTIISETIDKFTAPNYFDLADGPIMYCIPDTTIMNVKGSNILISVYSPNNLLTSQYISEKIEEILLAQKAYLGGTLPVKNYAFLIYLFEESSGSGSMGALEHSYSSLYSLPDINPVLITQTIKDVAAHEFFHIVTPLNIHSEEIGNFDFINPKMSKHLWLYEGVTEYAASLAQVKYGKMNDSNYLKVILQKIKASEKFNDNLPFTEMSKGCLGIYKSQYGNVYQKGALIGMALDIKLREFSGGKYGLQELMTDLSKEYGKTTSFKDDELFDKITSLTFPEIRTFFSEYVEGTKNIPYDKLLEKVGVLYVPPVIQNELSLGNINFSVNDITKRLMINDISNMNLFGKKMGYKKGDEIIKFDKVEIDIENFEEEFKAFKTRHKPNDKIKAVILRTLKSGKVKKVKLSAKAIKIKTKSKGSISFIENLSMQQLALKNSWIGK